MTVHTAFVPQAVGEEHGSICEKHITCRKQFWNSNFKNFVICLLTYAFIVHTRSIYGAGGTISATRITRHSVANFVIVAFVVTLAQRFTNADRLIAFFITQAIGVAGADRTAGLFYACVAWITTPILDARMGWRSYASHFGDWIWYEADPA